jgi:hypothetical protein
MWWLIDSFLYEHTQFGKNNLMCYWKIKNILCSAIRHYKFYNFFIISMTLQITISRIMFLDFVKSEFLNAIWSKMHFLKLKLALGEQCCLHLFVTWIRNKNLWNITLLHIQTKSYTPNKNHDCCYIISPRIVIEGFSLPSQLKSGGFTILAKGLLGLGSQGVPSTRVHCPTWLPCPTILYKKRLWSKIVAPLS